MIRVIKQPLEGIQSNILPVREINPECKHELADCVTSGQAIFTFKIKMATPSSGTSRRLVQYVIVRSDLIHTLAWPLGAVITQACHAATAAIHLHYSDPDTQQYLAELDSMHKVVLQVSTAITSHAPCASVPGLQCWVGLYSSLRFLMFEKCYQSH